MKEAFGRQLEGRRRVCRGIFVPVPDKYATFGLLFVLVLLLAGCGSFEEKGGDDNAPEAVAQPIQETSDVERPPDVAAEAAASVDEASIRTSLDQLTGASPASLPGGPVTISERGSEDGRRAAAEYMRFSFEEMGIPARILEFTYGDGRGFNVEATLEGTGGEKHLWVTAHLNSLYNAGAEDDASGLVAILSTARALRQMNPGNTVHFVAYDLEEEGLVGSSRYVSSVVSDIQEREGDEAIVGNLHSDMVGYEDGGGYNAVVGTCGRAGPIYEAILNAAEAIDSPITLDEACLGRSDHERFWEAGLPAAVITDSAEYDSYPWYHETGDTADKLNIPYLRSMIQLNTATTALLAEEP